MTATALRQPLGRSRPVDLMKRVSRFLDDRLVSASVPSSTEKAGIFVVLVVPFPVIGVAAAPVS